LSREFFFWNTATGTWTTTKNMYYNATQKFLTEKDLHFLHKGPSNTLAKDFTVDLQVIDYDVNSVKTDDCQTSQSRRKGHTHLPPLLSS
jgi:hypothetical protein